MTPFMARVTRTLDAAADPGGPALRASVPKPAPEGADEQVALRSLAEQLVSEANVVLGSRARHIELADELIDGQLGFSLNCDGRRARIKTVFNGTTALAELQGVGAPAGEPVELTGPDEVEALILQLLPTPGA